MIQHKLHGVEVRIYTLYTRQFCTASFIDRSTLDIVGSTVDDLGRDPSGS